MLVAVFTSLFSGVSLFCFGLAIIGCGYTFLATVLTLRFARQCEGARLEAAEPQLFKPSVTIVKPLYGAEPGLEAALVSGCQQIYAGMVNVVFGVHSQGDSAVPVAQGIIDRHPACRAELVIDARTHGSNGKVSNLVNMSAALRHEIVVLADSDITVPPEYLRVLTAALEDKNVGAVTCVYRGVPTNGSLCSRLMAAAIDWHFLPSVLVGAGTGLAQPCMGSTIALRRETLASIGGFKALADRLADDYALGELVRKQGLRTELAPVVVGHLCQETSFQGLWRHELRWGRTIRLVDPLGYVGSVVTHPVPLAVLGLVVGAVVSPAILAAGWLVLGFAVASRAILATVLGRLLPGQRLDFPLLVARDILAFTVFVASFFALQVRWRDADFSVEGDGTMQPLKEDPRQ